jgi:hypothetical protein
MKRIRKRNIFFQKHRKEENTGVEIKVRTLSLNNLSLYAGVKPTGKNMG